MNKMLVALSITLGALALGGCSASQLSPGAQKVIISGQKAPKGCKYVGLVTANQGNFFTGGFTSNQNLQEGAFNDLRNQAYKMGGNRVVLLMSHAASTGGGGAYSGTGMGADSETNVAITGSVYRCPNQ